MEMDGYLNEMFDLSPMPDSNPSSSSSAAINLFSFENSKIPEMIRPYNKNPNLGYNSDNMVKPKIINFSASSQEDDFDLQYNLDMEIAANEMMMNKRTTVVNRTPLQAQDHVMAERKRRQKLGQLFINLSKVVPGLKKLDKASLLEDAIDHLKTLQQQVNTLEEEKLKRSSPIDSIVGAIDEEEDDDICGMMTSESSVPEIKAMISKNSVLIKICCKNQKGLMSRIPWEIEKMHLCVKDIRIMPFGDITLVITILAEIQNEFRGTVTDIIEQLEMVFLNQTA